MNNAAYLDGFLKKRFKSVYYPYFAAMILWLICNVVFQNNAAESKAIVQFLFNDLMLIKTNLPFAWYVLAVLVWYVVFWCVAVVLKRADRIFQAIFAINVLWYIIGMTMKISAFYYNGTCCITLGCYIALEEQEMSVPKRKTCLLSGAAFGASVLFLYLFGDKSSILYSVAVIAGSFSFVWLLYTVGFLFSFKSKLTQKVGCYSYEIYLTQGIAYFMTQILVGGESKAFWGVFAMILLLAVCLTKRMVLLFRKACG